MALGHIPRGCGLSRGSHGAGIWVCLVRRCIPSTRHHVWDAPCLLDDLSKSGPTEALCKENVLATACFMSDFMLHSGAVPERSPEV